MLISNCKSLKMDESETLMARPYYSLKFKLGLLIQFQNAINRTLDYSLIN